MINNFTIEEVKDFWDKVAPKYEPTNKTVGYVHTQRFEKAILFADIKPDDKVLNIWSRTGNLIPYLKKTGYGELKNREVSPKMMAIAKQKCPEGDFQLTDLENLSEFPDNYFDKIISLETLEHTPKPVIFMQELKRILKPDGKLVMSLPPRGFEWPTQIYELFFDNHGEGPHRFLWPGEVKKIAREVALKLESHHPFIILPLGKDKLTRLSEKILTGLFGKTPLVNFGVRHFYIFSKND